MHMIADVVREFRNGLTGLVRGLDSTGLTPTTFIDFVGQLKALINDVGLRAFVETINSGITRSTPGGTTHEWAAQSPDGMKELVRYKFTVTGSSAWILFRMLPPGVVRHGDRLIQAPPDEKPVS